MTKTIEIKEVTENTGITLSNHQLVKDRFKPFLDQADEWLEKAKEIDRTQDPKKLAKEAREARLIIKKIRVNSDNLTKELKRPALDYNNVVQECGNTVSGALKPVEEELSNLEKYVEIKEKERLDKLREERQALVEPYQEFVLPNVDLADMEEDNFKEFLEWTKGKWEIDQENKRKAAEAEEKARIAKEEEDKRIREENERLRKEKEAADKLAAELKLESERKIAEAKVQAEKEAKAKAEREAKKHAEAEAKLKKLHDKWKLYCIEWLGKIGFTIDINGFGMNHLEADYFYSVHDYNHFTTKKDANEWLASVKKHIDNLIAQKEEKKRLAKEAEELRKAQEELKAKQEAERLERDRLAEEERKRQSAPDKEKLVKYVNDLIEYPQPELTTEEANKVRANIDKLLQKVRAYVDDEVAKL